MQCRGNVRARTLKTLGVCDLLIFFFVSGIHSRPKSGIKKIDTGEQKRKRYVAVTILPFSWPLSLLRVHVCAACAFRSLVTNQDDFDLAWPDPLSMSHYNWNYSKKFAVAVVR